MQWRFQEFSHFLMLTVFQFFYKSGRVCTMIIIFQYQLTGLFQFKISNRKSFKVTKTRQSIIITRSQNKDVIPGFIYKILYILCDICSPISINFIQAIKKEHKITLFYERP